MNEEQIEELKKSMYKAVKKMLTKALGVGVGGESKEPAKTGKDAVSDLMDPNFTAQASDKVPPRKEAQMNKSTLEKAKVDEGKDKKQKQSDRNNRNWAKDTVGVNRPNAGSKNTGISEAGMALRHGKNTDRKPATVNRNVKQKHVAVLSEQRAMSKPNLPKSETDMVKSENGVNKLSNFINNTKNKHKE